MADTSAQPNELTVHYIKDNDFKELVCSGAMGGPTPDGAIWIALYSERFTIPLLVKNAVSESGELTEIPGTREGKDGMVRAVHCGVRMSRTSARSLADLLKRICDDMDEPDSAAND